ncbi:hypothetical protein [Pseudooceanicola sp.]|uniref:hypothetical protein n=1 Tax=Pseudooceanicola sp. TaxID=1914328 RepID=UPI002607738A|nr:hypothetical protein [Pseudooceanicola sp.]MDF1854416.1 hypothetical protein [Pseudooceanicola sp.]
MAGVMGRALTGLAMAAVPIAAQAQDGLGTANKPIELRIAANDSHANLCRQQLVPEFNKTCPKIIRWWTVAPLFFRFRPGPVGTDLALQCAPQAAISGVSQIRAATL